MPKPDLPTRPTTDPDLLSAEWLCRLLDCVAYAMSHPQPDGRTIFTDGTDTLRVHLPASTPAAQSSSGYTGYFAVISAEDAADGTKQIKVLDNADPDAGIAGYTDLSDDPVPATVLPLQAGHLYLKAAYSETDGFSVGFGIAATLPKVSYELATILTDGTIIQRWCRNEPIYFGERFFV